MSSLEQLKMTRNHAPSTPMSAISIYGKARKIYTQPAYSYSQRKRVYSPTVKKGSYLRRTGKTIHVKEHEIRMTERETRFTFFGSAEDCRKAIEFMKEKGLVPFRQFEDRLSARGFLKNPDKYARKGEWVNDTKERKSP